MIEPLVVGLIGSFIIGCPALMYTLHVRKDFAGDFLSRSYAIPRCMLVKAHEQDRAYM
jgi:hypothetical protein